MKYISTIAIIALIAGCTTTGDVLTPVAGAGPEQPTPSAPESGYVCRELRGEADIRRIKGQGQGGRCVRIGDQGLGGCFAFNSDRVSFESTGCRPRQAGSADIDALRDQLDALEVEFENYLKGDK